VVLRGLLSEITVPAVKWWVPFAVLGGIVVLAATVILVMYATREDPEARPMDEAVEDFRSEEVSGPEVGPPPGVYELEGSGTEAVSFPPNQQSDGDLMPMTISSTVGGCWNLRIDYNEAHWEDWQLCGEGDRVIETGNRTYQRWDFGAVAIENTSTFTCDPPVTFVDLAAEPGDTTERSCVGTNEQVEGETFNSGTDTVVGIETVTVGGEEYEAMRVRSDQDVSGSQTGTITLEFWIRTSDGLPLRGERSKTVDSDSPIGPITYTENGSWRLGTAAPTR
jgi:hypothetical protein